MQIDTIKEVNKVSKSTNFTLSRTTVSKNISHSESVQEPVSRCFQGSSTELSLSGSKIVDFAQSASNPKTESKRNTLTTTSNLYRVIFDSILLFTISTIKNSADIKKYIYEYTDNQIHIKYTYRLPKDCICF